MSREDFDDIVQDAYGSTKACCQRIAILIGVCVGIVLIVLIVGTRGGA